jgi:hypothetical protein
MNSKDCQKKEIIGLEAMLQKVICNYDIALVDFEEFEEGGDVSVCGKFIFSRGVSDHTLSMYPSGEIVGFSGDFPSSLLVRISNVVVQSFMLYIDCMTEGND